MELDLLYTIQSRIIVERLLVEVEADSVEADVIDALINHAVKISQAKKEKQPVTPDDDAFQEILRKAFTTKTIRPEEEKFLLKFIPQLRRDKFGKVRQPNFQRIAHDLWRYAGAAAKRDATAADPENQPTARERMIQYSKGAGSSMGTYVNRFGTSRGGGSGRVPGSV